MWNLFQERNSINHHQGHELLHMSKLEQCTVIMFCYHAHLLFCRASTFPNVINATGYVGGGTGGKGEGIAREADSEAFNHSGLL